MNYILVFALLINLISFTACAVDCPDVKKAQQIIKGLGHQYRQNWCTKAVNGEQLKWVHDKVLPQLMSKKFLGVNPPPYWQIYAQELTTGCYTKGNLCTPAVQQQFMQCAISKIPLIMFQLGPWMQDNCEKMNTAVIVNWQQRKPLIAQLIAEYIQHNQ
ncbi:MAG: hypothetical protein PSV35_03555 [bacterium]|nr:hypothetical protein [bacterium]